MWWILMVGMVMGFNSFLFAERPTFHVAAVNGVLTGNNELSAGAIGGVEIGARLKCVGASISFLHYDKMNKSYTLYSGDFLMTPIMANLYFQIPITGREREIASFNFGGGGSYIAIDHSPNMFTVNSYKRSGINYREDVDSGFGFQIVNGLDFNLTERFSIGVDAVYLFFTTHYDSQPKTGTGLAYTSGKLDLNTTIILARAQYKF